MKSSETLPKIALLGGGQLGRMLIQAGLNFNLDIAVLDPDGNAPCRDLGTPFVQGSLTDYDTVLAFGRDKDLVTIEIENVNVDALHQLVREGVKVYPQPEWIGLIQNKQKQKAFLESRGFPTAPFVITENAADVADQVAFLPAVHKLATDGYDGRGVQILKTPDDLSKAFDAPGLLEKWIDFEKELAVIVARSPSGEVLCFPTVELAFHPVQNLVEFLFSPAEIQPHIEEAAQNLAKDLVNEMQFVGLLAIEMFLTRDGELLINEMAPRTHNSGHHTIEGNITSQFEQQLRAILDWPLGDPGTKIPAAMVNVLGEAGYTGQAKYQGLDSVLAVKGAQVHLYGKKNTKPFRKMGHVTLVDVDRDQLKSRAQEVKSNLKVIA